MSRKNSSVLDIDFEASLSLSNILQGILFYPVFDGTDIIKEDPIFEGVTRLFLENYY